jgi:hypothetical protein
MIEVYRESKELSYSGMLEDCVFCNAETVYWHEETNSPICIKCSKSKSEKELHKLLNKQHSKKINRKRQKIGMKIPQWNYVVSKCQIPTDPQTDQQKIIEYTARDVYNCIKKFHIDKMKKLEDQLNNS